MTDNRIFRNFFKISELSEDILRELYFELK